MIRHSRSMARPVLWLALPGALAMALGIGCKQDDERPTTVTAPDYQTPPPPAATYQPQVTAPRGTATGYQSQSPAPADTATPASGPAQSAPSEADLLVLTVFAVDIDTRLAELCKVPGSNVFFKVDSAKLSDAAKARLRDIATCVTAGPARGKDLIIIGHADPTGSDTYNKQLGMSRADSVKKYLDDMGVKTARVETESKGEANALREPFAWPLERRVTIRLRQP